MRYISGCLLLFLNLVLIQALDPSHLKSVFKTPNDKNVELEERSNFDVIPSASFANAQVLIDVNKQDDARSPPYVYYPPSGSCGVHRPVLPATQYIEEQVVVNRPNAPLFVEQDIKVNPTREDIKVIVNEPKNQPLYVEKYPQPTLFEQEDIKVTVNAQTPIEPLFGSVKEDVKVTVVADPINKPLYLNTEIPRWQQQKVTVVEDVAREPLIVETANDVRPSLIVDTKVPAWQQPKVTVEADIPDIREPLFTDTKIPAWQSPKVTVVADSDARDTVIKTNIPVWQRPKLIETDDVEVIVNEQKLPEPLFPRVPVKDDVKVVVDIDEPLFRRNPVATEDVKVTVVANEKPVRPLYEETRIIEKIPPLFPAQETVKVSLLPEERVVIKNEPLPLRPLIQKDVILDDRKYEGMRYVQDDVVNETPALVEEYITKYNIQEKPNSYPRYVCAKPLEKPISTYEPCTNITRLLDDSLATVVCNTCRAPPKLVVTYPVVPSIVPTCLPKVPVNNCGCQRKVYEEREPVIIYEGVKPKRKFLQDVDSLEVFTPPQIPAVPCLRPAEPRKVIVLDSPRIAPSCGGYYGIPEGRVQYIRAPIIATRQGANEETQS